MLSGRVLDFSLHLRASFVEEEGDVHQVHRPKLAIVRMLLPFLDTLHEDVRFVDLGPHNAIGPVSNRAACTDGALGGVLQRQWQQVQSETSKDRKGLESEWQTPVDLSPFSFGSEER